MKTAEQNTALLPTVEETVVKLATDSTSTALALATVAENNKLLSEKDSIIRGLQKEIDLFKEANFRAREEVKDLQRSQASVTVYDTYGDIVKVVNMDEAKALIEKEITKKFEREIKDLKHEVSSLKQELLKNEAHMETIVETHSAQMLRKDLTFRSESSTSNTNYENKLLDKKEEIIGLERQVARLTEGQQFSTIEKENLDLKSKLAKANKRFLNWEYFSVN